MKQNQKQTREERLARQRSYAKEQYIKMKSDETRYQSKLHINNQYYHVADKIKRNKKARAKHLLKKQEKVIELQKQGKQA